MHKLELLTGSFSIIKIDKINHEVINLLNNDGFTSITKTNNEISIITSSANIDKDCDLYTSIEPGFKAMRVVGQLNFNEVGILESILKPLAENNISVFTISTYDTDYILVKEDKLHNAKSVLKASGFSFVNNI